METIIVLLSLFIRLPLLSTWLEDWDSVQFAIALNNYNIGENLPHAPGYPIYIFLGKIFNIFTNNETLSLTLMSAIFGTLSILLIFIITRKMFGLIEAILAAFLTTLIPIHLLMSVSALTNMPGLFFLLLFTLWIYVYKDKNFIFVCFFGGLILGVRFTEIPVILSLLGLVIFKYRKINKIHLYILSFILGTLFWVIPMIVVTGWDSFLSSYKWISLYVINHDSIGGSAFSSITFRIKRIRELLYFGYTKALTVIGGLSIFVISPKIFSEYRIQIILTWFGSYLFSLIFFYNLELTRYTLPLLPPIVISVSFLLMRVKKFNQYVFYLLTALLFFLLLKIASYQGITFKTQIPPSVAPVKFTKENYSPKNTVVIGSYIYRQFEYYAPEYKSFYLSNPTNEDLKNIKYIVIDYIGLVEKLPPGTKYKIINTKEFSGDSSIYTRISKITINILELY